jgi:predicted nucleotidyltransferase
MQIEAHTSSLPEHITGEERDVLREVKSTLQRLLDGRGYRILLFGSKARGDFDADSDLDVAVIVENLDRQLKLAIFDAVSDVELQYLKPVSVLVMSSDEFARLQNRERRIALDILAEGIPL